MGLFGASKGGNGGGFNWGNAAIGFFGGPDAVHSLQRNRALRQQEDEAEALRRQRQQQIEAAGTMTGPNGRPMFSKQQLNALNPEDLSQLVREFSQPRQFGSEGGSLGAYNAETGNMDFTNAPRSYSDEGRLFQVDPQGNSQQVLDARQNDVRWQTGDWGAFATDRSGRPIAPGTNIQSPVGQQGAPQQPGATPTAAAGDFPTRMGAAFAQAGLPGPVIAGILGNAHHESGGQWNAAVGDGGTAHGAFQWRNERAQNFQRIVGVRPNEATPEQTAQFVLWELQNPEAAGMTQGQVQAIISAPTPEAAARLFSQHYERPNARLAHDSRRAALAGQYAGGQQMAQAGGMPNVQQQAATGMVNAGNRPPPGYQWQQDGALAPIPGGPGDQSRQERQDVGQVVQQYRSDPIVQQWQNARIATMQLQNLGQSGSPADDVAMIFSFMRALDPNSTVREGEFATAQNTAGIPERLRNYYNQAARGTLLGEQQRREFVNTAGRLYTARSRVYNEHANSYRTQLRTMGIENPNEFVPVAMAPVTEDRRRREQQNRPVDPQETVDAIRQAQQAMIPGTPQQPQFRILRRRRR